MLWGVSQLKRKRTLKPNMSTHLFGLIVSWCSGSTVSFGLTRGGSNPSETTIMKYIVQR